MKKEETYALKKTIEGITYDVYFFDSWSGYSHPVKLGNPISYESCMARTAYYQCLFRQTNGNVLFEKLDKIFTTRKQTNYISSQKMNPGTHFFQFKIINKEPVIMQEINLLQTETLETYLVLKFDSNKTQVFAEIVEKNIEYTYHYIYDDSGRILKAIIKNKEGETTIKF